MSAISSSMGEPPFDFADAGGNDVRRPGPPPRPAGSAAVGAALRPRRQLAVADDAADQEEHDGEAGQADADPREDVEDQAGRPVGDGPGDLDDHLQGAGEPGRGRQQREAERPQAVGRAAAPEGDPRPDRAGHGQCCGQGRPGSLRPPLHDPTARQGTMDAWSPTTYARSPTPGSPTTPARPTRRSRTAGRPRPGRRSSSGQVLAGAPGLPAARARRRRPGRGRGRRARTRPRQVLRHGRGAGARRPTAAPACWPSPPSRRWPGGTRRRVRCRSPPRRRRPRRSRTAPRRCWSTSPARRRTSSTGDDLTRLAAGWRLVACRAGRGDEGYGWIGPASGMIR